MAIDIQIETLSVAEKVQLLESVWQSLCAQPCDVRSPVTVHTPGNSDGAGCLATRAWTACVT
jgi:hypothetical protein